MTDDAHVPTLMTVHAHPDDETIGTGGTMAKAVADGRARRPRHLHPRRDGRDRRPGDGHARTTTAGWARSAPASWNGRWAPSGVTEWENLGYHDSDMMGRAGNHDPRSFWQADLDEAAGRLVWLIRRYQPDVVTTYNDFGGYGHPDHIRTHDVAVRAFPRAGDPAWYPEQLAPEHGGSGPAVDGRRPRAVDAVEALRAGHPGVGPEGDARAAGGARQAELLGAAGGRDAGADSPSSRRYMAKMLVPDETDHDLDRHLGSTARAQVGGASTSTSTQIGRGLPVHGVRARRLARGLVEGGVHPARVDRRDRASPRDDLFAGLV